jgi:hypothetical protein
MHKCDTTKKVLLIKVMSELVAILRKHWKTMFTSLGKTTGD